MSEDLQSKYDILLLELAEVKRKNASLEEECDMLAEHNERLQNELNFLKSTTNIAIAKVNDSTLERSSISLSVVCSNHIHEEFVKSQMLSIVTGSSNISCVGCIPSRSIIVCGAVDKTCRLYSTEGTLVASYSLNAPLLSIEICTVEQYSIVSCSLMSGGCAVISLDHSELPSGLYNEDQTAQLTYVQLFNHHSKYGVGIQMSRNGCNFATISYDKSMNVYHRSQISEPFIHAKTYKFATAPESVVIYEQLDNADEVWFVVALRDVCYLTYIRCESLSSDLNITHQNVIVDNAIAVTESLQPISVIQHISLNEHEWDLHCSFTPLYLSLSPNQKYLLVSTNHSRHYCYLVGSNKRIRTFLGHTTGDYSKPRTCWSVNNNYIYSNTDENYDILVFAMSDECVLHHISGHKGAVKDLCYDAVQQLLITVSFDKTIRVWK